MFFAIFDSQEVRGLIHWPPEFVLISFSLFLVHQLVRRPASWVVLLYKLILSLCVPQRVRFPICGVAQLINILTLWSMVSISQNVCHQACWECRFQFHHFYLLGGVSTLYLVYVDLMIGPCVSQKVCHSTCKTHFTLMSCVGLSVYQNVCHTISW
jgi:hypothetical protein